MIALIDCNNFCASCFSFKLLMLILSDETEEALAPDTLYVGNENVLYCEVKEKRFPARFLRSAYYQLAEHVVEEDGTYVLPLNGKTYPILTKHKYS